MDVEPILLKLLRDSEPNIRAMIGQFRRRQYRADLRELAISLALQLTLEECCRLVEATTVVLPSGRTAKGRCYDRREPEHLTKARELYANRLVNPGYAARARAILKRHGVPECYMTLAFYIVNGGLRV